MLSFLAVRAVGRDHPSTHLMTSCLVTISTSLFISVNLGSLATDATTYTLLGLTLLMNTKDLSMLVLSHRAGDFHQATVVFAELMLNRAMELVLPLSYLACFLAAYHGPNSSVLGNVGNSYWHYQVSAGCCYLTREVIHVKICLVLDIVCLGGGGSNPCPKKFGLLFLLCLWD